MTSLNYDLFITPNVNVEFFKEVYIVDIFSTPDNFLFLFETEKLEEIVSLLELISLSKKKLFPVILKIKYLVDEKEFPLYFNRELYVFNLAYYIFLTPPEKKKKIYQILTEKDILNNSIDLNSINFFIKEIKEKKIMQKIAYINDFHSKIYKKRTEMISSKYKIKEETFIEKYKTFYEISQKEDTGKERPFDITDFLSYFVNSKNYPFVCFCTDEKNDYSGRMMMENNSNNEEEDPHLFLLKLKNKFLKPFLFLQQKKNKDLLSYKELSKYERIFYNKKYFFYIDEEFVTQENYSTFIPAKAELLNINQKEIMVVSSKGDKIKVYVNKKNKLQGFYNSFDKNVIKELIDNIPLIDEYFDKNTVYVKEYLLSGTLQFVNEGLIENLSDLLFNAFVNLYKPISEERYLFNNESFTSYFERKNPSKFYFNTFFNLIEEQISFNEEMLSKTKSYYSSKSELKSVKSKEKTIKSFLYNKMISSYNNNRKDEDDDENDDDYYYYREIEEEEDPKSLHKLSIENTSKKRDNIFISEIENQTLNYIKFFTRSSYIEFKCNNLLELEKLKYNLEETVYHFYEIFKKSLHSSRIKNLLLTTEKEEENQITEKEQFFPTNFKKLFNIKNYAFDEIIKKKEDISIYSNYCQCNFQPILLNNKMEADDWYNSVYEIEGKFFTCKEQGFSPQPNKTGKFLCCKKKDKSAAADSTSSPLPNNQENTTTGFVIKKNISSFTPKDKYGEITEELVYFFRELFENKDIDLYRKGTEKKTLSELFFDLKEEEEDSFSTEFIQSLEKKLKANIYIFVSNKIENEYLTTEVSPLFPGFNKDWKTLYKNSYILFYIDFHFDTLIFKLKEEEKNDFTAPFSFSTKKIDFIFEDYNRKIIVNKGHDNDNISTNNMIMMKEKDFSFLSKTQIKNLTFQFYIFYEICSFFGIKKELVLSSRENETENFFTRILNDTSMFSFVFYNKKIIKAFPSVTKIVLPKKYENDMKILIQHFPVKELYKNFFEDTLEEILKISKNEISVKIPISFDFYNNFSNNKKLYLKTLYEMEEYKNKIIFKKDKLVTNNRIFRSSNPNFIFLPSYHRYNLYFCNVNFDSLHKCFNCDLYTENYIVETKKEKMLISHPNTIFCEKNKVKTIVVYEFDIYFEKLVKIFENKSSNNKLELNLLFAPFNSEKEVFVQSPDFIDLYVNKKKMIFIPFEFV